LLGRMIFGGFFLYNGFNHLKDYKQMAQYAKAKHVPVPEAAVLATGVMLTAGGASILLGAKPRLGALAILSFLGTVSPAMHDFWNDQDPGQKQNNLAHFMKNMALLGGALSMLGVEEPWPASVQSVGNDEDDDIRTDDKEEKRPLRLSQRRMERRKAA
jgi:putative oxidoreductase